MLIYKVKNQINDKVYVGQTTRPLSHRWAQHLRDSNKYDYPLYRAIRKYGKHNFKVEIIHSTNSIEELNKKEIDYINKYNCLDSNFGYNILLGGKNYKLPQKVRDKISKSLTGKKKPQYISDEEKSEIARKNGSKTPYDREWATSNGSKPFRVYKAICKQFRKRNQPSIYEKGEYIGEWLTSTGCAKDLEIKSNHIRSCLVNKRKQSNGYIFERIS